MKRNLVTGLLACLFLLAACSGTDPGPDREGRSALIIVDVQYDFLPGGALATSGGDEIIGLINALQAQFDLVVATQDWHPPGHGSFASAHPGHRVGEVIELNGLRQVLWPDHAVQHSRGAQLAAALDQQRIERVFRKGLNPGVDSYSGFFDNDRRGDTGMRDYLISRGVTDVVVVGLALDYCVKYTALDARRIGLGATVLVDATRAVNLNPGDAGKTLDELRAAGVVVSDSAVYLKEG
ncbi:bifunctional nicotinamidase/pyrazinamidase [Parahaliea aestuarii]|uniref:Nicotinamidase n=1 Tax=Parahaliea aestuarii TaxID=1852021 RepID=A0A5C8ZQ11_9GAMM|nr:bifunctional nicotinamidase/pyrazinamidase [Parahaliea aestuarii]TXS90425.1 bifunctional nicotinamidase/pyrazinamidase [Parahaliea aestuarii]